MLLSTMHYLPSTVSHGPVKVRTYYHGPHCLSMNESVLKCSNLSLN